MEKDVGCSKVSRGVVNLEKLFTAHNEPSACHSACRVRLRKKAKREGTAAAYRDEMKRAFFRNVIEIQRLYISSDTHVHTNKTDTDRYTGNNI